MKKIFERVAFYFGIIIIFAIDVFVWVYNFDKTSTVPIFLKNLLITIVLGVIVFGAIWNRRKTQKENSQQKGD